MTVTYTVAAGEEAEDLLVVIGHLRASNGKLLRELLKTLAKGRTADHRRLAETLIHHPNLRDLIPQ